MKEQTTFRETLKAALEARCAQNPRYSLRAFARDLGISPSRLSDVLNGRYGLSRAAAAQIAKFLGMNARETDAFCDQVDSVHARDRRQRAAARERVAGASAEYQALTLDGFQVIADWYHYAILELTQTKNFKNDPTWIAKRLGLSVHVVQAAIERLQRLDLLEEKEGKLFPTGDFTASPDGIPSEAIRKFHRQVMEKAIQAVDFQTVEERDMSSIVLAFDTRRMEEAKADIKRFRRAFDAKYGSPGNKDQVYCLSLKFFRMQEKPRGDE